ncbi:MAG: protein kinase [Gemmatimonadales bacterium]|nr:protein kinase [Gemmatimonadales bacterium]
MTDLRDQLQATLGSAYILERELGGGGMSRVFIAEDTSLGRKVVVKVLLPDLAATVNIERFRREIQLAAKLQHPHIVPVLSAGISDGLPYYTMPFIEGESLRARLARSGELPVHDTARILRDVLSALSYAHEHGVVHRDIKPDNVLLTGNHAVVADFGVAKALSASTNPGSSLTSLGVALGTPAYMSPEQAAADPSTDHRADLYGVGAMAYEMLTGQQVFSARSPQAMLAAHATQKPEPIDARRPSVPRELSSLIMRSLEKHAADRPQSAAEMLAELEAAVTPSGATTPHIGAITPSRSKSSERRGMFMAMGAAILLAVLASSTAYWRGHLTSSGATPAVVADTTPSLAVLPFDNLGKSDDEYFAQGMTDEISSKLGTLSGLTVIGRQSSKSYANTTKPAQQIGKELGATYLLTGTVQWDRSRPGHNLVKITPVLLRAGSGAQIWSEPYQGEATGVFDIQSKVAESVARAMRLNLSQSDKSALASRPTSNPEAYDYYLRGLSISDGAVDAASNYLRAAALYERAIDLDPRFALAYAQNGIAQMQAYWFFRADDDPHRLAKAKASIDSALSIDPNLVAGHVALANYYYRGKLDYKRALDAIAVAQGLSPNDPDPWDLKGLVDRRQGRWDEAVKDMLRSTELDPRNTRYVETLCETEQLTRRYDESEKTCARLIALSPEKFSGYSYLSRTRVLHTGDTKTSLALLRDAERRADPADVQRAFMAPENRAFWPAILDADLMKQLLSEAAPAGSEGKPGYLTSRLMLAIYTKNKSLADHLADSVIAVAPRAMSGTFFDSELHSDLALAFAVKGDRQRSLEEGRLSMEKTPHSVDALRAANNLELIARSQVVAGAYDQAFSSLQQLLSIPSNLSVALLRVDPWYDPLRRDPRFVKLVTGK